MNLAEPVRFWARWQPDAVAVITAEHRITWKEFDERTDQGAAGLQRLGLAEGDRLAILAANRLDWCVATIAAIKAGLLVVPINNRLAPREIAEILADADVAAVITDSEYGPQLALARAASSFIVIDFDLDEDGDDRLAFESLTSTGAEFRSVEVDAADTAMIAYTSGTTGLPKGVMLSHNNIVAQATDRNMLYGWSPATLRTLLCVPLSITGGIVTNFLLTYVAGGTLYLERTYDAERVLKIITQERITCMMGASIMWDLLTKVDGFAEADISCLTTALGGGQPPPPIELYQQKGVHFHQVYGCSEAAAMISDLPPRLLAEHPDSVGMPSMHTRVRVVDDAGHDVASGEVGEIIVKGPTVTKGYWRNPEATAQTIIDGWLHTGDLGVQDANGLLTWIDRKKDMYRSGGLNVYPAEVERVLGEIPGVRECAVVAVSDKKWSQVGAAILFSEEPIEPDAVLDYCRTRLAGYKVPRYVVGTQTPLPRNASGKVLRRVLREQYSDLPQQ